MKGVVNRGIQDFVLSEFGEETWEKVKEKAGCEEPFFAVSNDYPDEMTIALAQAASELSGMSLEDVLIEFGKFWVGHTGKETYASYFNMGGATAKEFLKNTGRIHEHVTRSSKNAKPPRFEFEEPDEKRLIMHYFSDRDLCQVARGLILGVGLYFGENLEVRSVACKHRGAVHCTMEVTFLD